MPIDQSFPVNADGVLEVDASKYPIVLAASVAVVTTVAAVSNSVPAALLLAANASRKGAVFFNSSQDALYIKLGSGGSVTDFSVAISSQTGYELPPFTGKVYGTWAGVTPSGSVQVTELS